MSQEYFKIQGQQRLVGEIPVYGAKNHVLKLFPVALLSQGNCRIENVPHISDVLCMMDILEGMNCTVNYDKAKRAVDIIAPEEFDGELPKEIVPQLRASIVLIGPTLARYGKVIVPHPGGDKIGRRPMNFFVEGLRALGAEVIEEKDRYIFLAPNGLQATEYVFPQISVTGTETLVLASLGAKGVTILDNVAIEPEVTIFLEQLVSAGASIEGIGTTQLRITGKKELLRSHTYSVIPDRIEAGSFMMLAAATNSDITITDCDPNHLRVPIEILRRMGVPMTTTKDAIHVATRNGHLSPYDVVTHEYPGFPTDLQAPMTIVLTQAQGSSSMRETIYEGRLFYTDSINAMGARISMLDPYRVIIQGATPLYGTTVESPDIRAGIAQVIAGLVAEGETIIQNMHHIDRGYETIETRLQAIGAHITRENA